jgi:hypothetical protein
MKRQLATLAAAGFLAAGVVSAQNAGEAMTIRGEVVEVSCFTKGVAQGTGAAQRSVCRKASRLASSRRTMG